MDTFISYSESDTKKFAHTFASKAQKGDVLILCGDLGSGKTKFVEGFLSYFHLEDQISSPTFTIVNEYNSPSVNIYHFDLYRLESIDEFYAIGGPDYIENGICIFEWGELIEEILPSHYIKIEFEKSEENLNYRKLKIARI